MTLSRAGGVGSSGLSCTPRSRVSKGMASLLLVVQSEGVADLEDISAEVEGRWLPTRDLVQLPPSTGEMIRDVVRKKRVTAGSLDGWGWGELEVVRWPGPYSTTDL